MVARGGAFRLSVGTTAQIDSKPAMADCDP
jgi:hypothetical protein